jgi:pyruvate formate lyase activating enzyme
VLYVKKVSGIILKIQKYAIHDGPGIRTLVFLKGCPLRCLWCCNPESWELSPEIIFIKQRCIYCGNCVKICYNKAIEVNENNKTIDEGRCTLCGRCLEICVARAIELLGKRMSVEEVMNVIEEDKIFYAVSGGGVTLSGGEPAFQFDFSMELLKECRKRGVHTAIETSGYTKWAVLKKLGEFVDLFLYDIKVIDRKKHIAFTGVPNDIILRNLERLVESGKSTIIRYPLIPEHNDSNEDIDALTNLAFNLNSKNNIINEVHIMPYHRYGAYKYNLLRINYKLKNLRSPAQDEVNRVKEKILKELNIEVKIGG